MSFLQDQAISSDRVSFPETLGLCQTGQLAMGGAGGQPVPAERPEEANQPTCDKAHF